MVCCANSDSLHGSSRDKADAKPGKAAKNRQYRRKLEQDTRNEENAVQSVRASQLASLEEEVLKNVEEAVRIKVEEAMGSEEVKQRIAARLREERSKLEAAVNAQVEEEKAALMERKRREQEEAKRKQDELEKILAENRRKVEEAQKRAAQA
ncbi:arginine and glutamate-rich 1-domain-containing protein [Dunaliella salina]|uniref:Arginine and glutamate-rich 1-domain-containing protein n=1 Tax=Dunaliella salina TaxID=3046 RepID=A0ABQ7GY35_DUNSA|nr:arginine and glutamate-rich 1-domain-containing protein [Dunaliella salina]|eukprot:KAF5839502.1 arginine and glutamate-rich 1-domain-containing protein [Dunaliella salina]